MQANDLIRLQHMLDAAMETQGFVSNRRREDLDDDRQLVWALVKAIEIIGEAAGQLSDEARLSLPVFPWKNIISMRNRLVHAYFDINLDILWKTVIEGLPPIIEELNKAVDKENRPL